MLQIGRVWLTMTLICLTMAGNAQDCTYAITGLVEDAEGGVLAGATILIEASGRGVAADAEGRFRLDGLCAGNYELRINFIGYAEQRVVVRVPGARSVVIKLAQSARILHDIVVEGSHAQTHALSQAFSILSGDEITASKGKPLGEMIAQIPGVQSITTGSAIFKPVIHGLYGQRILILNNGIRQEGQQWGLEHAPEIDTYIASEIEVVKGSEAIRYGADALGGVIIVNPQPLHYLPSVGAELNSAINSNNRSGAFSGMLEGGFSQSWGWRVQGTVKKAGDFHAPDYNLSNTGMEEIDMSAAIGFGRNGKSLELYASTYNAEIGILRSAHIGNLTDLEASIRSGTPRYIEPFTYEIGNPRQRVGHHLVKLSGAMHTPGGSRLSVVYGAQADQRKEYDVPRSSRNPRIFAVDLVSHTLDFTLDMSRGKWSWSAGASGGFKDNFNIRGTALLPDYRQLNAGLFGFARFRKDRWLFEGGARVDRQFYEAWFYEENTLSNPEIGITYTAVSAGASVHVGKNALFSSNLGVSSRPPHVSELFSSGLHHSAASIEYGLLRSGEETGTGNVKAERSHQWTNTLNYTKGGTSFEVSGYANYFRDYIFLTPSGTQRTVRGYFPVFAYRQADVMLAGADASVGFDVTRHLAASTRFSYVWASEREHDQRLPFIPPPRVDLGLTYRKDALHNWRNFYVTVSSQTVLRQTDAPRTIYPSEITSSALDNTFDFMPPPSSYTLLRLEAGSRLPLENRELTISFAIDNMLDTSYRNYLSRLRYYADEPGRNFSIRLNYTFHAHH